jgi:hypothetical protein
MKYISLCRKFCPDRGAELHPQIRIDGTKKAGAEYLLIFRRPGCLYETL